MNLIDWVSLARNALWILGLSIALAAWSYAWWSAGEQGIRRRVALASPSFQAPFSLGMVLFSGGMAWGSARWWENALWLVLGLLFLWQAIVAWQSRNGNFPVTPPTDPDPETIMDQTRIEQTEDPHLR